MFSSEHTKIFITFSCFHDIYRSHDTVRPCIYSLCPCQGVTVMWPLQSCDHRSSIGGLMFYAGPDEQTQNTVTFRRWTGTLDFWSQVRYCSVLVLVLVQAQVQIRCQQQHGSWLDRCFLLIQHFLWLTRRPDLVLFWNVKSCSPGPLSFEDTWPATRTFGGLWLLSANDAKLISSQLFLPAAKRRWCSPGEDDASGVVVSVWLLYSCCSPESQDGFVVHISLPQMITAVTIFGRCHVTHHSRKHLTAVLC